MRSKHEGDGHSGEEHRVVVDMTALEAVLFLRDQPVVLREIRRRVRKGIAGCDDARWIKPE